jgi:hypothetical protein
MRVISICVVLLVGTFFSASSAQSPSAPIGAPVNAPLSAPQAVPVAAPSLPPAIAPAAAPVAPPAAQPIAPPVAIPIAAPIVAPVASPVVSPAAAPVQPPVAPPVNPPVAAPINPPLAPPMATPVAVPVAPPMAAPVGPPVFTAPRIQALTSTQPSSTVMVPPTASIPFTVDYDATCASPTVVLAYLGGCSPRPSNISCASLSSNVVNAGSIIVSYTCSVNFNAGNTPSSGSDYCPLTLVVSCGAEAALLDVGRVIAGIPQITTSSSTPSYALISSSQSVEITISGSNFPTSAEFSSSAATLQWEWTDGVSGGPCGSATPAPSCSISSALTNQIRCLFAASTFTASRDGCRASLMQLQRYDYVATVSTIPSILTIAAGARFLPNVYSSPH